MSGGSRREFLWRNVCSYSRGMAVPNVVYVPVSHYSYSSVVCHMF